MKNIFYLILTILLAINIYMTDSPMLHHEKHYLYSAPEIASILKGELRDGDGLLFFINFATNSLEFYFLREGIPSKLLQYDNLRGCKRIFFIIKNGDDIEKALKTCYWIDYKDQKYRLVRKFKYESLYLLEAPGKTGVTGP